MKNMELLGLSVVAAALIMTTGCSSSDDSSSPASGPSAPAELSSPMEMNGTSAKNAMYGLKNNASPAAARRAASKAEFAALAASRVASGGDSGTDTYNCGVSGTYTYSYSSSYTGNPGSTDGSSWSDDYSQTYTANNCVDNYSSSISNGEPVNLQTDNGTGGYSYHNEYNADTNISKHSYSSSDNYTTVYENNETGMESVSRTRTNTRTRSNYSEQKGQGWTGSAEATWKSNWTRSGERSSVDVNSTGSKFYGYKKVWGNQSGSEEGVQDDSNGKFTQNGFYAYYDMNDSGEWNYVRGSNYVNFVTVYSDAGNESNITLNGGYGDDCLGGTVNFTTSTLIQENTVDYQSTDATATGDEILPYTGKLTMSGTSTATVTFKHDESNNTSATLNVNDSDETPDPVRWNQLAVQNCVN